ncbi:hypothetical protein AYK21_02880 [Thermoplasmatales archaeon SG8-52-2]|nr:MAG: hypothetical protein AYK21_02880 [Thermoplasmatales archaeon SG8-52-2]
MNKILVGILISMLLMSTFFPISGKMVSTDNNGELLSNTQSGGWYKTYGGPGLDCFKGLDLTPDGGYIMAGETEIDGDKQAWIVKTNSTGDIQWEVTYGTPLGRDALWPVISTSAGGYLGGGWSYNSTQEKNDALLIKTDEDGAITWVNTYGDVGDDQFYSLLEIADGYLAVGMSSSYSNGTYSGFVAKIAFNGDVIWIKPLEKEGYGSEVDGITVANEGDGYVITGGHYSSTEKPQARLIKIDEDGNIIWDKSYGEISSFDWWISIANTPDDNYIIAGGTNGNPYGKGIWGPDIWLIKVDNNGDIIWNKTFGLPILKDYSLCAQPTSDGGYIFTGHLYGIGDFNDGTHAPFSKICLIKTDENGKKVWRERIPKTGHGRTVRETSDGYILCGFEGKGHGTGSEYGILIKIDKNGKI